MKTYNEFNETFWVCTATIATNSKSHVPNAYSYILSGSASQHTYSKISFAEIFFSA